MLKLKTRSRNPRRRGAATVVTAVSITVLIGMAALAIDVGMLYSTRTELQRTADAAAIAAASQLLDKDRLMGNPSDMTEEIAAALAEARRCAGLNQVLKSGPSVSAADVVVGRLDNPADLTEPLNTSNLALANSVQVTIRRDDSMNGPVSLFFAQIFGLETKALVATATGTFHDRVVGYRVTEQTGNAQLLPLALHVNAWNNLLARVGTVVDKYAYCEETGTVWAGADGIPELNLFPGSGTWQLPPGNFGTVDITDPNNSTAVLSRQIRYGVTQDDLAYTGGELRFGPDGTLLLNGDTGLSAAVKDDLEAIKGMPRAIPIFNRVVGPGNNSMFTVIAFAGIRIMNVKLTGAMTKKEVVIQPAYVVDAAAITDSSVGPNFFVYGPVSLTR